MANSFVQLYVVFVLHWAPVLNVAPEFVAGRNIRNITKHLFAFLIILILDFGHEA